MTDRALEIQNLCKRFAGGAEALRGLDLAAPEGCVYGLVGRNGAGKTTAIRILMGLMTPTAGKALLFGQDMRLASRPHRARVVYVPQVHQLHPYMTLEELAAYYGFFYPRFDAAHARTLAQRFELPRDRPLGELSGGEQRKAAMALAFAARTEAIVLDEPAANLDPIARRQLIDAIIEALSEGDAATVLFSTHILSDLERAADRVGFMDHGRMLRESDLEDLRARVKRIQIIFDVGEPPPDFQLPGVLRSQREGPVLTALVEVDDERDIETLKRTQGLRVAEFPIGLEDLFIELVGAETAGNFALNQTNTRNAPN